MPPLSWRATLRRLHHLRRLHRLRRLRRLAPPPPPTLQVKRSTKLDDPAGPRVLMYASKRIEAGEELQWDYGAGYWAAREGLVDK